MLKSSLANTNSKPLVYESNYKGNQSGVDSRKILRVQDKASGGILYNIYCYSLSIPDPTVLSSKVSVRPQTVMTQVYFQSELTRRTQQSSHLFAIHYLYTFLYLLLFIKSHTSLLSHFLLHIQLFGQVITPPPFQDSLS